MGLLAVDRPLGAGGPSNWNDKNRDRSLASSSWQQEVIARTGMGRTGAGQRARGHTQSMGQPPEAIPGVNREVYGTVAGRNG